MGQRGGSNRIYETEVETATVMNRQRIYRDEEM